MNVYGYYSHDRFEFNENEKYAYSNMNASANWRAIFNEKVTANFTAGFDHYDYMNDETVDEAAAARILHTLGFPDRHPSHTPFVYGPSKGPYIGRSPRKPDAQL